MQGALQGVRSEKLTWTSQETLGSWGTVSCLGQHSPQKSSGHAGFVHPLSGTVRSSCLAQMIHKSLCPGLSVGKILINLSHHVRGSGASHSQKDEESLRLYPLG